MIACSSTTGQKTKFRLNQPLLSLQLKDQHESQTAPASLFPATLFLKVSWLLRHQLPLQICGYVALPNISLRDVTGTCSCPVLQCKGRRQSPRRREASALSVPAIPHVPVPASTAALGRLKIPAAPSIGSRNTPASLLQPCSAWFFQYLLPFNFLFLTMRLELFKGQKISRPFSDLVIFRL